MLYSLFFYPLTLFSFAERSEPAEFFKLHFSDDLIVGSLLLAGSHYSGCFRIGGGLPGRSTSVLAIGSTSSPALFPFPTCCGLEGRAPKADL
jgi:hypothetical protein